MKNVGMWTVSLGTALVDEYLAAKPSRAPLSNPEILPA